MSEILQAYFLPNKKTQKILLVSGLSKYAAILLDIFYPSQIPLSGLCLGLI